MLKNILTFIVTVATMLIYLLITDNSIIVSTLLSIVTIMVGFLILGHIRNNKRQNLIEKHCDPQAFLEATEKQRKTMGKGPRRSIYFDIDKAAGLYMIGEFQEAKEVLLSINKSYLSAMNGTFFFYTTNLIYCLYELGEISQAEEMFEKEIPLLAPVNRKMMLSMELLIADRLFFVNRIEECKDKYEKILNQEKLSKRKQMEALFRLAQIDERNGDVKSAELKYKEVCDNGNKLWVALQSKKFIENN